MLTISPFLVIDDNTNIKINERARKINRRNSSKLEKEPKSSTAQTESIDMSPKHIIRKSQMYISMN